MTILTDVRFAIGLCSKANTVERMQTTFVWQRWKLSAETR